MSYINNRTVHDLRHTARLLSAILADVVMAKMRAEQLESSTGGVLISGSRDTLISGVSIDTRTLHPGDLFFAIRGARNDGHQYIELALSQGALGAVVDRGYEVSWSYLAEKILFRVEDTHNVLKDLASDIRC